MVCEYCKSECGDEAVKCPNCGAALVRKNNKPLIITVVIVVLLLCIRLISVIPVRVSENSSVPASHSELKRDIKNSIARNEYGRAVKLCEENSDIIENNEYFDDVLDDLINHFSGSAKNFYKAAATYTVKQYVAGNDVNTGFEGYDPATCTIDAKVLKEHLPAEDYVAAGRTTIVCGADKHGQPEDFVVTIDICGRKICYPADEPLI